MDWNRTAVRASLLVLMTLMAYAPALRGGFVWDDDAHVTDNATLTSLGGLQRIWLEPTALPQYYPMVHTTFWIERHLWGLNPLGYHLVNVLLHLLNALLLWFLLERLSVRGAWLAAAVFALHPVHVESVAWITERKNVLSGLFYFLAGACFLRFHGLIELPFALPGLKARRDDAAPNGLAWEWEWYAAGFVLFLCALLSKTVTATLPLALGIVLWWKRDGLRRRDLAPLVPLLVVGAALGLVTVWLEKHHVGAQGGPWDLSPIQRCLLAGRALWFYAGKLVWPLGLSFFYPRWPIDAAVVWQDLFPLAAASVAAVLWALRRRIGKGPLAAVAFFAGTLFPALGFVDVYPMRFSWVADHFQYLASAGLIALFAAIAATWVSRLGPLQAQAGPGLAALLLVVLTGLTWHRGLAYKDAETLWRDTIAKTPDSWTAHNNLGVILMRRRDVGEAIHELTEAIRLAPAIADFRPDLADTHLNLGNLLAESGRGGEAIEHYQQAMSLHPQDPAIAYNLGNTLLESGRAAEAIGSFQKALELDPELIGARTNLGNALASLGRTGEAIEQYNEALRRDPNTAETHNNLGTALVERREFPAAIDQYKEALRLKPDYAEAANNLGLALTNLGRLPEAIESYREAVRIKPDFAEAHSNLGVVLANSGKLPEAIEQFEQAVKIKPDFENARENLEETRKMAAASPPPGR